MNILFLTILVPVIIALIIIVIRQRQTVHSLESENRELAQSKESSLEYIDALWESQQEIIQEEKLNSLSSLVTGVAHELNTPLGVSLTSISYLESVVHTIENKEIVEDITPMLDLSMKNLRKAITLVERFKEISATRPHDDIQRVTLSHFIDFTCAIVDTEEPLNNRPNVIVNIPDDVWICVSQTTLSVIVKNVIENAYEFASNSELFGEVVISHIPHKSNLILVIKDNGKGIHNKDLNHIFDPFYTTQRAKNHYGLGLPISFNLINRYYNGHITCTSEVGVGSIFTISVPDIICDIPNNN